MKHIEKLFGRLGFYIIDLLRGTRVLSVYSDLASNQYLSSVDIDAISRRRMQVFFKKCLHKVSYYKMNKAYTNIDELPFLDKATVIDNYKLFISEDVSLKGIKIVSKFTGGSTGSPFKYYTSRESQSFLWAGILLSWDAAGYKIGDKVAMLAGDSLFRSNNLAQKVYYRLMNISLMDANTLNKKSCHNYISDIKKKNVKFIYGYTSAIFELASLIIKSDLNVQLKSVITTSEVLTPAMRGVIEKAFNCRVFDQYGCNDAGLAAFECEYHSGLHLNTLRAFISIDEYGCLHSTDMFNDVMPLINYSTGDLVEFSKEECPCGRGFPLLKNIKGRSNDMIKTLSGDALHASYLNKLFSRDGNILTYQATYQNNKLKINLITDDEESVKLDIIKADIMKKLHGVTINFAFNEPIIKLPNGKMKNLIMY
jgi:phenylacetate-CoA ligase